MHYSLVASVERDSHWVVLDPRSEKPSGELCSLMASGEHRNLEAFRQVYSPEVSEASHIQRASGLVLMEHHSRAGGQGGAYLRASGGHDGAHHQPLNKVSEENCNQMASGGLCSQMAWMELHSLMASRENRSLMVLMEDHSQKASG